MAQMLNRYLYTGMDSKGWGKGEAKKSEVCDSTLIVFLLLLFLFVHFFG